MSAQIPQTPVGVNALLNHLLQRGQLKNDAALSRALEVAPPVIRKLRHAVLPLGAKLLLDIHLLFDIPVRDLMALVAEGVETAAA
jgi:hypothetical protein